MVDFSLCSDEIREQVYLEAKSCQRECVLVAPYVKRSLLENLLQRVGKSVSVTLITKAVPYDFLLGVSDIEAWKLIWEREGRGNNVLINDRLHAKYYRFDEKVFLGSANLTDRAFDQNIEALLHFSSSQETEAFERSLLQSPPATIELYKELDEQIKNLRNDPEIKKLKKALRSTKRLLKNGWLPHWGSNCKNIVSELYEINSGESRLPIEERVLAEQDLKDLGLRGYLGGKQDFKKILRTQLLKTKLYDKVNRILLEKKEENHCHIQFGKMVKLFNLKKEEKESIGNAIFEWLTQVLDDRFEDKPRRKHSRLLGWKKSFQPGAMVGETKSPQD